MKQDVLKAINGDKDAFTLIFLKLQNKLYSIAFNRLKNEADALDAIQETIISTYNNLSNLEKIDSFESWVISILINECNKIYNKNVKMICSDIEEFENIEEIHPQNINEDLFFGDLIKHLNEKEQMIMILYYKNDYSIEKISSILKIKINTVKSIMKRAKSKIKKYIKE